MDVAILYPVFVQVALTFGLQIWMGLERFKSVRSQTVQRGAHAGILHRDRAGDMRPRRSGTEHAAL